jgi:hypothetical protein
MSQNNNNMLNILNIKNLIQAKKYSDPIDVTENNGKAVYTPYNVFPYNGWFKGNYLCSEPLVAEREAGYRKIKKYNSTEKLENINHNVCFQGPCSLVKPCIPEKINERDKLELNISLKPYCCDKFV